MEQQDRGRKRGKEKEVKCDLMVAMKPQFTSRKRRTILEKVIMRSIIAGINHFAHFMYHYHPYLLRRVFGTIHANPSSLSWNTPQTLHVSPKIPRKTSSMPQFLQKHLPPYFVPLTGKVGHGLRETAPPPTPPTPWVLRIYQSRSLFPKDFQAPCSSLLSVSLLKSISYLSPPDHCPPGLPSPAQTACKF